MLTNPHKFTPSGKLRARGAGVPFEGMPGELNSITDVNGTQIGYKTLNFGEGPLIVGKGPVRTGVTAVLPLGLENGTDGVFAGSFILNGNGEMTGLPWIEETGRLEGPITITNTHSAGIARDATIKWMNSKIDSEKEDGNTFWMPVAGETCDNWLNDMNGFHVEEEHIFESIENASGGQIEEGSIGGGTGMSCYQFKGGTGTSSRIVKICDRDFTVGVLVQSNFGIRKSLTIAGVPIGQHFPYNDGQLHKVIPNFDEDQGSIVVIIATDAPLLPHQLKRISRRAGMGISRSGGIASNGSGDFFITFSTANTEPFRNLYGIEKLEYLGEFVISPLFEATIQAVDEAILNSLFANENMSGRDNNKRYALPVSEVVEILKKHNRWSNPDQN